ncbi:hypothetical protein HHK36_003032 [Tetracentron sinense]|uniref:Uncharacterized protein n=1 Tax=Tetracentron sinense TaxID=13715 RepID=A0A834ZQG3_TETSI|nr:hypothetical protein HHK36_003032 [Tetracentron sinense]
MSAKRRMTTAAARQISQLLKYNGKQASLVDTLALVRRLEAEEIPLKQAEAIISVITEVFIESETQFSVSKDETQKIGMILESNMSKLNSELESSQERHIYLFQRQTEKIGSNIEKMYSELHRDIEKLGRDIEKTTEKLGSDIKRMCETLESEMRYEIVKDNAELRLDLKDGINKLHQEIHLQNYDVMRYCIGTIVSISAVGLAVICILK